MSNNPLSGMPAGMPGDPNIERMLKQAQNQPRQQAIDPVTPVLLENLVRSSEEFAKTLVRYILDEPEDEIYSERLYDICFSVLRPLPQQGLPLDAVRSVFFNIYFVQSPGAVFDYVMVKIEKPRYAVSEKGIKAFGNAYQVLTEGLYNHFVRDKRASAAAFDNMLSTFATAIRD
ncbi:MAG: hypothetical protein NC218_01670 [Acetobacter sp.]|nr:hypothetical protein [Acetobacter sp.]